jgi:hypothetical protein
VLKLHWDLPVPKLLQFEFAKELLKWNFGTLT